MNLDNQIRERGLNPKPACTKPAVEPVSDVEPKNQNQNDPVVSHFIPVLDRINGYSGSGP